MDNQKWMERALYLANLGKGKVSPNPMVGCVIVFENKIIGEGYHMQYGEPHAEVNAIQAVSDKSLLNKAQVYVTLEPCSHFGKTPPCADLLIKNKVAKVIIATKDPNPLVAGKGIEKLKAAGIAVEVGICEKEANLLNARFFTFQLKKRPYIILKWAETKDGFIARENYDSKWISNTFSRKLVHQWRSQESAILVGKNTALYDNPQLNVRDWSGNQPIRIVLDANLSIPKTHHVYDNSQKTFILNTKESAVFGNTSLVKLNDLSLNSVLDYLYEQKILSIIMEGGSSVLNSFINQNLWDEARVFVSSQTFEKGIKAPKIPINPFFQEEIREDSLNWYKNF